MKLKIMIPPLNTPEGRIFVTLLRYPRGLSVKHLCMEIRAHYNIVIPSLVKLMEMDAVKIVKKGSSVKNDIFAVNLEYLKAFPSDEEIVKEIDVVRERVRELIEEAKMEEERVKEKIEKRKKMFAEKEGKT